ncbi:class C beta-lactamase [Stenotrophomonas sp. TWI700]|uniref:class C beta-lactamase n=1 Tax=Stenotrophomonas sp. TWI700 TaxID=3136792 RepID=UPI00320AD3A8
MSQTLPSLLLSVAVLACPTELACAVPASAKGIDASLIDTRAAAFMRRYRVPGMVIGLTRDGHHYFYSYGVASKATGQPITPDTLFELGSISKTFTATLAAYAQTLNVLSLMDPVGNHVQELQPYPIGKVPLWQLGTHCAGGLPLQFPDTVKTEPDALRYYQQWHPSHIGGERRSYAKPSIALLGVAAARALGLPFQEAMEGMLFPTLALTSTWLRVPQHERTRYAQGYNAADVAVRLTSGPYAQEAYGVRSSARDLIRFIELNITLNTGDPGLDQALLQTQFGRFEVGPMTQALAWEQYHYPLPLADLMEGHSEQMTHRSNRTRPVTSLLSKDHSRMYSKSGTTAGFASYAAYIPSRGTGIVILTNKTHPDAARAKMAHALLEELTEMP